MIMYPTFFPIIEEEMVQKIFSSDFSTWFHCRNTPWWLGISPIVADTTYSTCVRGAREHGGGEGDKTEEGAK